MERQHKKHRGMQLSSIEAKRTVKDVIPKHIDYKRTKNQNTLNQQLIFATYV